MERRRTPRFRMRFDALIAAGPEEGAGTLTEISYSGARIEDSSLQPPVGTRVRLYLFVRPVAPFEIEGLVARHTETGFAVTYELFDVAVRRLVDDITARVVAPAAS